MTLANLLKDQPMPVKVRCIYWDEGTWFNVMAMEIGYAIGLNWRGLPEHFKSTLNDDWELYEEPNQPIVRWLWANTDGEIPYKLFSEDEIKNSQYSKNGYNIKLEWSRTEFL